MQGWLGDGLFGNPDWMSNEITEAWLKIWHLLTLGVVPQHSLSWNGGGSYKQLPYQVFCPMEGVVVFDHHVEVKHLAGVEVIFLTGLGVSEKTQRAISDVVDKGATCVALPHLVPATIRKTADDAYVVSKGGGKWVITNDFLSPVVHQHILRVLPQKDMIRYCFGDTTVTFRPIHNDPNQLAVDVK